MKHLCRFFQSGPPSLLKDIRLYSRICDIDQGTLPNPSPPSSSNQYFFLIPFITIVLQIFCERGLGYFYTGPSRNPSLLEHETISMCPDAEENNYPQWKGD